MTNQKSEEFENFMEKLNDLQRMQDLELNELERERKRHSDLQQTLQKEEERVQEFLSHLVASNFKVTSLEQKIEENRKYLIQLLEDIQKFTKNIQDSEVKLKDVSEKLNHEQRLYETHISKMNAERRRCIEYFENSSVWKEHKELKEQLQQKTEQLNSLKRQIENFEVTEKKTPQIFNEEVPTTFERPSTISNQNVKQDQLQHEVTITLAEDYNSTKHDAQETQFQLCKLNETLLKVKQENSTLEQHLRFLKDKIQQETAFQQHNQQSFAYLRNLADKSQKQCE